MIPERIIFVNRGITVYETGDKIPFPQRVCLVGIDWQCLDNKVDGHEESDHAVSKLNTSVYLVLILPFTDNHYLRTQSFAAMTADSNSLWRQKQRFV